VHSEERKTETQEGSMEEGEGKDDRDTQMPEVSEPLEAQRKRTWAEARGSRKKSKAHMKPMETSLMEDNVDLIDRTTEDRLLDMWENDENHKDSILEKIQEVKAALEQFKVKTEQQQQNTIAPTK
jgi:hypothetical protein